MIRFELFVGGAGRRRAPGERAAPRFPEYDRPGRAAATRPEDDEEFLRKVRERAEAQRRAHREAQRRRAAEEAGGDARPETGPQQ